MAGYKSQYEPQRPGTYGRCSAGAGLWIKCALGNNINAVIKGAQGRWLDVKQKGRNYSGGLYFGDTQIADVTAVRGVPGILFPDGTFESLF
ncbi:hypothetical protein [Pseudoalteromonas prydzensis]|uniref:hypothetical protein n=1 Tax=Pseudoalteromonas prydzensis TaxID=182141 RepID=UPI003FD5ABAE